MEQDQLTAPQALRSVLLGLLASAAVAFLVAIIVRLASGPRSKQAVDDGTTRPSGPSGNGRVARSSSSTQPAVDVAMPAQVPHHFSEDVVVPGFTAVGQDVERRDDAGGRSPEGV